MQVSAPGGTSLIFIVVTSCTAAIAEFLLTHSPGFLSWQDVYDRVTE